MDVQASNELYQIKRELQNIITEIDSVADAVNRNFTGIGNDTCASCLRRVAEHYRGVKNRLDRMDTTKLSDEFLAAKGGNV